MKTTIYIATLLFAIAGCNNTQKTSEQNEESAVALYDTNWKLAELEGKPVVLDSTFNKDPYVIFTEKEHKVQGHAGCNGFGGLLEVEGEEKIKISRYPNGVS